MDNKGILLENLMGEDEIKTLHYSLRLSQLEAQKKNQINNLGHIVQKYEMKETKKYVKLLLQNKNIIDLLNHKSHSGNNETNRIKNKKKK